MILPTKHLREESALLRIGAEVLIILNEPKTVSRIWTEFQLHRTRISKEISISYNWFVLALDLLFLLGAIELDRGRILRTHQ